MRRFKTIFGLSEQGYKDLKKGVLACVITNMSLVLSVAVTIGIFGELFGSLDGKNISWNHMWMYFAGGLIAAIITFFCSKNDYRHTYVSCYSTAGESRIKIAEIIRKLPMRVFDSKDITELTTNMMDDCEVIEHAMSHVVPPLISNTISSTIICVALAFFNWRMAIALFCTLPISLIIIYGTRRLQSKWNEKLMKAKLKESEETQEYLDGIKLIKAFHMDGERFEALSEAFNDLRVQSLKTEIGTGVFSAIAQFVLQAGVGVTIFVGTNLLTKGDISILSLMLSLVLATRIYGPILSVLTILPMMFHMMDATKRMRELMEIQTMDGRTDVKFKNYDIDFKDVTFRYQDESVLKNVSLHVPQGQITALVGPSGSGKSTIAKLIARFWDVNEGSISIGGVNIKDVDPECLMKKMAFVFQDVTLFSDTVMNNIRIGNMNATDEEVYAAAKAACCDEFINKLPDGYNTLLGENGNSLSGGERQRISIARALLKDAPIILLDEATASLDAENEVYLQTALSKLIQGKTVIIIAHRLRTISGASQIIVLKNGQIQESGQHKELMKHKGIYEKLYTLQQNSLEWSV